MFHAVIMPFRFFLGKFSFKQTAIISRYTSAFQRELHDYFSLSLNKNQNQHPKHRAKNQWKKRNCFVGKMMITDNPLRFRSGAGFPYIIIQNLAAVFREFFFTHFDINVSAFNSLAYKNLTFILTLCFWM